MVSQAEDKSKREGELQAESQRKFEKIKLAQEANQRDLVKKREELRVAEQNIKIVKSGGQIEDAETTL